MKRTKVKKIEVYYSDSSCEQYTGKQFSEMLSKNIIETLIRVKHPLRKVKK